MKQLLLAGLLLLTMQTMVHAAPVDEKVEKAFYDVFANATRVKWTTAGRYYEASFYSGDVLTRVLLNKKGRFIRIIRVYQPQYLPPAVLVTVKKQYPQETLQSVTEVSLGGQLQYHCILRDSTRIFHVTADGQGGLQETARYHRGDL